MLQIEEIEFASLPKFSKLFLDFVAGAQYFYSRFPANATVFSSGGKDYLKEIAKSVAARRDILLNAIRGTMKDVELSPAQKAHLEKMESGEALTVTAGQQIGFLGGALYSFLKGHSAVGIAERLGEIHPDCYFAPVFWIEDNDHDAAEISYAYFADGPSGLLRITHGFARAAARAPASELMFGADVEKALEAALEALPNTLIKGEISAFLNSLYKPGAKPLDVFIQLLQRALGQTGLLFISASKARESGVWRELIEFELSTAGLSRKLIEKANSEIAANGYKIQAKASDVNLFLHRDGGRHSIELNREDNSFSAHGFRFTLEDLRNGKLTASDFSPKVLARPVFQSYLLPDAAIIGGPGEIGYLTQIKELYAHFGVEQPAVAPRLSATFVPKRVARFLDKQGLAAMYFMKDFSEIEKELMARLGDEELDKTYKFCTDQITDAFERFSEFAKHIEPSLERSAAGAAHKSLDQLEHLYKKVSSLQKKSFSDTFEKYRKVHSWLFPGNGLQERSLNAAAIFNESSPEQLTKLLRVIAKSDKRRHYMVYL
ncbi:MAG: bacillithiol biosynthesis cysteine-adding enzyme BshC [Chloroflexota bacterium]